MVNKMEPMRMPYEGKNVPHCVIEVNQKCNISCKACYKDKSNYTKPLRLIKTEIDYMISKRNVSSISLAGGEPCLHPELSEVIKYVVDKGLHVQILSNGLILTEELLLSYKEAGLSKVYLHIDSLQKRPDVKADTSEWELNHLRDTIAKRVTDAGLQCAMAITLYQDNLSELDEVVSYINESPYFQRLLVTCCTDFRKIINHNKSQFDLLKEDIPEDELDDQVVTIKDVEKTIFNKLNWSPFAFIPSNQNLDERRWVFYYAFSIIKQNGAVKVLRLPASFKRLAKFANDKGLKKHGRYPFGKVMSEKRAILVLVLHAFTALSLTEFFKTMSFLINLVQKGSRIYQKSFVFQQGPNMTEKGIEYCKDCPDATIRDGKLVPLCTADFLKPKEGTETYSPE